MDASINISMEPFRAFVADMLPEEQRTAGFAMQALFIGLGAVIASMMPWLIGQFVDAEPASGTIPLAVRLSFDIGAVAFLGAVVWTIRTTPEYPPEDMDAFRKMKAEHAGIFGAAGEILRDVGAIPPTMRRLAWVQIFTWLGLFCMWLYFGVAVAHNVFHGAPGTAEYDAGIAWGGNCFAVYSAVCFGFSFVLPAIAHRWGRERTHAVCLAAGAVGLISVAFVSSKYALFGSMVGVGIAWASTLAMPYAILAGCLPPGKTGIYMGIFNFFIVVPEIIAAFGFGTVMKHVLTNDNAFVQLVGGDNRLAAVVIGGVAMAIASVITVFAVRPPSRASTT
jgi:maltose/moltooligosaccharide transporter